MRDKQHAFVVALVAILLSPCTAQVAPCPSNPVITGYTSIAAMNNDMEAEFTRIQGGGAPQAEYIYTLCPRQEFDASAEPLRPLLSGIVFRCGVAGLSTDRCTITGGSEQIRVETSQLPTYPLSNVNFSGVTFTSFTNNAQNTGTSVNVLASDATSITFSDVAWTDFNSQNVIKQQAPGDGPSARVTVENGSITSGEAENIFDNSRGTLTVSNIQFEGIDANTAIIASQNSASSSLRGSTIQTSRVASVTTSSTGSLQEVVGTTVTNMFAMEDTFFGTGDNTRVNLSSTSVVGNLLNENWRVLSARDGAQARALECSVTDNTSIQFGFVASSSRSIMIIDDTLIANNVGIGADTTSAPVISLQGAITSLERTQFDGNSAFTSQALSFFGAFIAIQQTCFRNSDSTFVVFVDNNSNFSGSLNFVDSDVGSVNCPAPGNRLFKENVGAGCFLGGACEGQCQVLATSDRCLANEGPTSAPTSVPEGATPAPTRRPASAPTRMPTSAPSRAPVTLSPVTTQRPTVLTSPPTRVPTRLPTTPAPTRIPTTRAPSRAPATGSPSTATPTSQTTPSPSSAPMTSLPTISPAISTSSAPTRCPGAKLIKQKKTKPKTKLSKYATRSGSRKKMTTNIYPKHYWHTDQWYNTDSLPETTTTDAERDVSFEEKDDGFYYFYICPPTSESLSQSRSSSKDKSSKKTTSKKGKMMGMKSSKRKGKGKSSSSIDTNFKGKGKSRRILLAREISQESRPGLQSPRI